MKILVYGFKPWGLVLKNISEEIIKELAKENLEVDFIVLPVDNSGISALDSFLRIEKPELIIGLGHIPMSRQLRIEQSAHSEANSTIQSNIAGYVAIKSKIMLTNKIGDFYCNKSYYLALNNTKKSLFVHVGSKIENPIDKIREIIQICKEINLKGGNFNHG